MNARPNAWLRQAENDRTATDHEREQSPVVEHHVVGEPANREETEQQHRHEPEHAPFVALFV